MVGDKVVVKHIMFSCCYFDIINMCLKYSRNQNFLLNNI